MSNTLFFVLAGSLVCLAIAQFFFVSHMLRQNEQESLKLKTERSNARVQEDNMDKEKGYNPLEVYVCKIDGDVTRGLADKCPNGFHKFLKHTVWVTSLCNGDNASQLVQKDVKIPEARIFFLVLKTNLPAIRLVTDVQNKKITRILMDDKLFVTIPVESADEFKQNVIIKLKEAIVQSDLLVFRNFILQSQDYVIIPLAPYDDVTLFEDKTCSISQTLFTGSHFLPFDVATIGSSRSVLLGYRT